MLKFLIDSLDGVDDSLHGFYTPTDDGKFQLQLDGGPQDLSGDVQRLKGALEKERDAHKQTKSKYAGLDGVTLEEIQELRDKAEDLEYQLEKAGKPNDEAIEERAEKLAARQTRKLEEQIAALQGEKDSYLNAIALHEAAANQRKIKDAVEAALTGDDALSIVDSAREDIIPFAERIMTINDDGEVVSKDGVGFEPGLSFSEVLGDIQASNRRGHWFKQNKSAGANGGDGNQAGGPNPFKAGPTFNLTKASQLVKEDPKRARALIMAAGESPTKFGLPAS
jgi:DNA-binding transcriptional MerR regulator